MVALNTGPSAPGGSAETTPGSIPTISPPASRPVINRFFVIETLQPADGMSCRDTPRAHPRAQPPRRDLTIAIATSSTATAGRSPPSPASSGSTGGRPGAMPPRAAPPTYRPRAQTGRAVGRPARPRRAAPRACPDLRATVLLRELRDEYGYSGQRTPACAGGSSMLRPRDERRARAALRDRARRSRPRATGPTAASWPLGDGTAELHACVAVLGCSRMVAVRFATDKTRATTLRRDRALRPTTSAARPPSSSPTATPRS